MCYSGDIQLSGGEVNEVIYGGGGSGEESCFEQVSCCGTDQLMDEVDGIGAFADKGERFPDGCVQDRRMVRTMHRTMAKAIYSMVNSTDRRRGFQKSKKKGISKPAAISVSSKGRRAWRNATKPVWLKW